MTADVTSSMLLVSEGLYDLYLWVCGCVCVVLIEPMTETRPTGTAAFLTDGSCQSYESHHTGSITPLQAKPALTAADRPVTSPSMFLLENKDFLCTGTNTLQSNYWLDGGRGKCRFLFWSKWENPVSSEAGVRTGQAWWEQSGKITTSLYFQVGLMGN